MDAETKKLREDLVSGNIDDEAFQDDFFPFDLTWFVTFNCTLDCPYCFVPPSFRQKKLKPVSACRVLKRCQEKGIFKLNILGGEPFLEKDILVELADRSDEFDVVYRSTSTNGLIYDEDVVKALSRLKYKHILQVSLDSATPKTHFKMRRNHRFDEVMGNIKKFTEAGLSVMLGMTLTRLNVAEIEQFAQLGESLGVEMLSYGGMMPMGRGHNVKDWHFSFAEMKQAYQRIQDLDTKLPIVLPNDIYGRTCAAGFGQASMLPNGDIYPCNMFLGWPEAKLGNFFDEKLNKFNNPWFIKLSAYKVPAKCDACDLPPICDSACKAVSYDYYKDFREHAPFCHFKQAM